jgi:hypothetical protein
MKVLWNNLDNDVSDTNVINLGIKQGLTSQENYVLIPSESHKHSQNCEEEHSCHHCARNSSEPGDLFMQISWIGLILRCGSPVRK